MGYVNYKIEISAPPEKVFDLIAKVEDFSKYSSFIKSVEKLPDGMYRWKVKIRGVEAGWDARVVESIRPVRFSWESISGIYNKGSYTLKEIGKNTIVSFEMSYRFTENPLLDLLSKPLQSFFISKIHIELLENVKRELEGRS